jgi:hypothetical protein
MSRIITIPKLIDEDSFVSDAANQVPSQQSVKAYADTKQPKNDFAELDVNGDWQAELLTGPSIELDINGDMMPSTYDIVYGNFELDVDGNLQLKAS